MLNRVKALPDKLLFAIGFFILLIGLMIVTFHNVWFKISGGILLFIAISFIVFASDKKHNIK